MSREIGVFASHRLRRRRTCRHRQSASRCPCFETSTRYQLKPVDGAASFLVEKFKPACLSVLLAAERRIAGLKRHSLPDFVIEQTELLAEETAGEPSYLPVPPTHHVRKFQLSLSANDPQQTSPICGSL